MTTALPTLDGNRCARVKLPVPLCDACENACPADAIVLSPKGGPRIRADACTACGACAAVCPEAAFAPVVPLPDPGDRVWSLGCAGADSSSTYCLNAISMADLAWARAQGIRAIEVSEHDCANCARSGGVPLTDTLSRFNELLQDRAIAPLALTRKPQVKKGWFAKLAGAQAPDPSRRAILRGRPGRGGDSRMDALQEILAAAPEAARRFPFAPSISADLCTGCDACLRGCPTGALRIIATDPPAYEVAAEKCTGCGWCVALCDDDAISVRLDAVAGSRVPLRVFRCRSCKVLVHRPETDGHAREELCNICAKQEYSRPDNLVL